MPVPSHRDRRYPPKVPHDLPPTLQLLLDATGNRSGKIFGSDVYRLGSDIATAAVHAGVLVDGETAAVKLLVLNNRSNFVGATRNGVVPDESSTDAVSFRLSRATQSDFSAAQRRKATDSAD